MTRGGHGCQSAALSVVVAGLMPSKGGNNLYCEVIVKKVDAQTRAKTRINELLRD